MANDILMTLLLCNGGCGIVVWVLWCYSLYLPTLEPPTRAFSVSILIHSTNLFQYITDEHCSTRWPTFPICVICICSDVISHFCYFLHLPPHILHSCLGISLHSWLCLLLFILYCCLPTFTFYCCSFLFLSFTLLYSIPATTLSIVFYLAAPAVTARPSGWYCLVVTGWHCFIIRLTLHWPGGDVAFGDSADTVRPAWDAFVFITLYSFYHWLLWYLLLLLLCSITLPLHSIRYHCYSIQWYSMRIDDGDIVLLLWCSDMLLIVEYSGDGNCYSFFIWWYYVLEGIHLIVHWHSPLKLHSIIGILFIVILFGEHLLFCCCSLSVVVILFVMSILTLLLW